MLGLGSGLLAGAVKLLTQQGLLPGASALTGEDVGNVVGGINVLACLMVSFRMAQAYSRFWDGASAINKVQGEWFDACRTLVAFSRHSTGGEEVDAFNQIAIRLFSVLFAVALTEVSDSSGAEALHRAETFELIDPNGLDRQTLYDLKHTRCRVELVMAWVQALIVDHVHSGVLTCPPPILTRVFQEISNGAVALQQASAVSRIPFPHSYNLTCYGLLALCTLSSAVYMHNFVSTAQAAFFFCFIQTYFMWSISLTANELVNPFGTDDNDVNLECLQRQMNSRLRLLVKPKATRTPALAPAADLRADVRDTLESTWKGMERPGGGDRGGVASQWSQASRGGLEEQEGVAHRHGDAPALAPCVPGSGSSNGHHVVLRLRSERQTPDEEWRRLAPSPMRKAGGEALETLSAPEAAGAKRWRRGGREALDTLSAPEAAGKETAAFMAGLEDTSRNAQRCLEPTLNTEAGESPATACGLRGPHMAAAVLGYPAPQLRGINPSADVVHSETPTHPGSAGAGHSQEHAQSGCRGAACGIATRTRL